VDVALSTSAVEEIIQRAKEFLTAVERYLEDEESEQ